MILIYIGIAIAVVAWFVYRYHLKVKQDAAALINQITRYGSKLETGLLDKLHALENGGHLAAGTTQQLIQSQTVSGPNNGGQPPAELTPAS